MLLKGALSVPFPHWVSLVAVGLSAQIYRLLKHSHPLHHLSLWCVPYFLMDLWWVSHLLLKVSHSFVSMETLFWLESFPFFCNQRSIVLRLVTKQGPFHIRQWSSNRECHQPISKLCSSWTDCSCTGCFGIQISPYGIKDPFHTMSVCRIFKIGKYCIFWTMKNNCFRLYIFLIHI